MDAGLFAGRENVMLCRKKTLDYDVENSTPKKVHIDVNLLEMLTKGWQTPLKAKVIILKIFILHIVLAFLVNGVVSQVNKLIALRHIRGIFLSSESSETFFENIDSQRVHTGNANIYPQIEFVPIYQKWVSNIARNNRQFFDVDFRNVINDVNASTSRQIRWLHDP